MQEKQPKCNSCHTTLMNLKGSAVFTCPHCEKKEIVRCFQCRRISAKYTCPGCRFTGPN